MRNTKKILIFILITALVLSMSVYAEPPAEYGPYPATPLDYIYKVLYRSNDGNGGYYYWYIVSKRPMHVIHDVNNYDRFEFILEPDNEYKVYHTVYDAWSELIDPASSRTKSREEILYTSYDIYDDEDYCLIRYSDDFVRVEDPVYDLPPIEDCRIYTLGVGDTINIDNNETTSGFYYLQAYNASFEMITAVGSNYPNINTYENITSGEWEWEEPEGNSNTNIWKITSGSIKIGIPNNSNLVVKVTTKTPNGGYDVNPSPDRGNYESGIFGTIAYGIDTLIYWVSYPFVAVGNMFVSLIDEIKTNLSWINDFNSLVQMLFGWVPERFQGLLYICVSATVISFIIRVFRGS